MKASAFARINDRTFLWLACIAALCAGFYLACIRLELLITTTNTDDRQIIATIAANDRILAQRIQLQSAVFDLDKTLQAADLQADHPTMVAHFITTCARIALLHHTRVVQIDERRADSSFSPTTQNTGDAMFEKVRLDVTLSGSYRDLLLAMRDLANAPVATSVSVAAIERGDQAQEAAAPDLTAHLHVTLVRVLERAPSQPAVAVPSEMLHARSF